MPFGILAFQASALDRYATPPYWIIVPVKSFPARRLFRFLKSFTPVIIAFIFFFSASFAPTGSIGEWNPGTQRAGIILRYCFQVRFLIAFAFLFLLGSAVKTCDILLAFIASPIFKSSA